MLKKIVVGLVVAALLGTAGCVSVKVEKKEEKKPEQHVSASASSAMRQ